MQGLLRCVDVKECPGCAEQAWWFPLLLFQLFRKRSEKLRLQRAHFKKKLLGGNAGL
jgi:hypothetical protein